MITGNSIHGHEVLHLVHHASPPLTRPALEAEAARLWGADARFHTCSSEGMPLGDLLDFLMSRGKIVERNGALGVEMGEVCSDGQSIA